MITVDGKYPFFIHVPSILLENVDDKFPVS